MADHIFEKKDIINRLEMYLGKSFAAIDNKDMFARAKEYNLQKGIVGDVVEQCIFGYSPDSKQEADLLIIEDGKTKKTELKTTGLIIESQPKKHYVAKEPMSITGVGVYDIGSQTFEDSHFWEKIKNILIVYYHYASDHAVLPYEYKDFPLIGYEFHEFSEEDTETLKKDWEHVRSLCVEIISHHPGPKNREWKKNVKEEYIEVHGSLRPLLTYIDLAPKFPPRFRLKKPVVSSIIRHHFGYELEQLPDRYLSISDVDKKCLELTKEYNGRTVADLLDHFGIIKNNSESVDKAITEKIVVAMFGGKSQKINQIELFVKYGLIGKTVVVSKKGGKTEDMKLFRVDFNEWTRTEVFDEEGKDRPIEFEDSELYAYFADNEILCIVFKENDTGVGGDKYSLLNNTFIGFQRIVFNNFFIDKYVRRLWIDTREKVMNGTLTNNLRRKKNGEVIINKNGSLSYATNFMKSTENVVFLRGGGQDSSLSSKTELINGIQMLPQYVWIKGSAIVEELKDLITV